MTEIKALSHTSSELRLGRLMLRLGRMRPRLPSRGPTMATPATRPVEERIRRMTPVSAPAEQRAGVAALSKALEGIARPHKRRPPKCKLVGPEGETIAVPESVFYV